jgi:hypothetical protein
MRVEKGSQALNQADFLALGGTSTSALGKADMMSNGIDAFGNAFAKTTTFVERIGVGTTLASTGLTPLANFVFGTNAAVGGGANAAGGGFVLYPSKPNTNMMSSVYSK